MYIKGKGMFRMRANTGAISTLFLLMISTSAIANCTKITAQSQLSSPSDGVASSWLGSLDNNNGSLGLPSVVDISTSNDFQPDGTLLASSVAPFTTYAINSGFESERVLFRCDAADANQIFEMYATKAMRPMAACTMMAVLPVLHRKPTPLL